MVENGNDFVEAVNEAVENTIRGEPTTSGELRVCVMAPVKKGFIPTKADKEAIKLKDIKIERMQNARLFDKDGNCTFDVDDQNFDILRITGVILCQLSTS